MGSPLEEFRRIQNEDDLTSVEIGYGFWVAQFEVTQAVYKRIVGGNPSEFKGDDRPVDSVSWEDAARFCRLLTEREAREGRLPEGYSYRLPTEAEWEYVARGGTETPFSFGVEANPSLGNFQGSYAAGKMEGESADDRYGTVPVGSFSPNPFRLYDVHGNVAEWVYDRFWDRLPGGSVTNPVNVESGRGYAVRGGSWRDSADRVRSAAREGAPGSTVRNSLGFRVVLGPDPATFSQ